MLIKVAIADDHKLFREGLVNLLSDSPDIEVVAQADNGEEAVEIAKKYNPDVFIMDIAMPVKNGIEATAILTREMPNIKVIAISMHSEKHFIKGMLEAGAFGYLLKSCNYVQLLLAINTVISGKKYMDEEVTEVLIHNYIGNIPNESIDYGILSKREMEILVLISEGKSSQEIAEQIFISVKTVGTHRQNIMEKLNLNSTTDIVKYAIKKGIISI